MSHCKFCYSKKYLNGLCNKHYYNLNNFVYSDIHFKNDKYDFTVTRLQQHWLNTRGGRTVNDLHIKNGKLYVIMSYQGEEHFVKLPNDNELKDELRSYLTRVKYPKYNVAI